MNKTNKNQSKVQFNLRIDSLIYSLLMSNTKVIILLVYYMIHIRIDIHRCTKTQEPNPKECKNEAVIDIINLNGSY